MGSIPHSDLTSGITVSGGICGMYTCRALLFEGRFRRGSLGAFTLKGAGLADGQLALFSCVIVRFCRGVSCLSLSGFVVLEEVLFSGELPCDA